MTDEPNADSETEGLNSESAERNNSGADDIGKDETNDSEFRQHDADVENSDIDNTFFSVSADSELVTKSCNKLYTESEERLDEDIKVHYEQI